MRFDPHRSFHIFTRYPSTESFPFQRGDHLRLEVVLIPHPMHAWVRDELSASALWYASVRPAGQPDPEDLSGETILLEIERLDTPAQSWQIPWQVDPDEVLITLLDTPADLEQLPPFDYGAAIPARIILEVTEVTGYELIPATGERVWQIILNPLGEQQENLISSEVELLIHK